MAQGDSLFKIKGYPAWFSVDTALLCGSAVHWLAMSLVAFELSHSVALAGWFATVRGVVSGITQTVGGTFIDRHDHRRLMLFQAGVCCLLWLAMALLFTAGRLSFALFVTLSLTSSSIFGFLGGTTNACLITVVGPERYARAESVNQGRDAAVNTAGSPLGAALYGIAHAAPFFASAVFDAIAFVSALVLKLPRRELAEHSADRTGRGFLRDMADGWRWVAESRMVVTIVALMMLVTFGVFGIHQAVSLHLVSSGVDAMMISYVNVASGMATMAGSVMSARICDRVDAGRAICVALPLMALSQMPAVLLGTYAPIMVSSVLLGLPMPLLSALGLGFVFSKTAPEMQGRARAAIMTATMLVTSGTGAMAGSLLEPLGFRGLALLFDSFVVAAALICWTSARVRNLPKTGSWDTVTL